MNTFIATIENNYAVLNKEESFHCAKVLRLKAGDKINLIDGKGNFYEGRIKSVSDKKCLAEIISGQVAQKKRNYYLHLAITPTKQMDRIEWMIEKVVEIGVDEISFIKCKNSERVVINTERIIKIAESAVKQSLQAFIPKINSLINFKAMMNSDCNQKLIAHCNNSEKQNIKSLDFKNKSNLILIGPEGDFTLEEINLALENKFNPVSLGESRLRTETAGLYVCQAISILT